MKTKFNFISTKRIPVTVDYFVPNLELGREVQVPFHNGFRYAVRNIETIIEKTDDGFEVIQEVDLY